MANVTCHNANGWKGFGTELKDVCQIAEEMMSSTCQINIQKLKSQWYDASQFPDASQCACEHVMYNLLSACAGCQKWSTTNSTEARATQWQTFIDYKSGQCPEPPSGASSPKKREVQWMSPVPNWASNLNEPDFSLDQALAAVGRTGGETAVDTPTTALASPTTTVVLATNQASPSSASAPQSSNSGPNIGAIVGGVIGALAFLGILAGLWFWLHRRRRRARDVAPSAEFIKPEYYATPPLLAGGHDRRDSDYHDDIEELEEPAPATANRLSWAGGLVTTRRREECDGDMLPPFTRGTYIGPSPHEKGHPERRETGDSDQTMRTTTTNTLLLSSSPASPARRTGPSEDFP